MTGMTAPFDPQPTSTAPLRRAGGAGGVRVHVPAARSPRRAGSKTEIWARWTSSVSLTRWTRDGESWHRQHQHAQARFTSDVNAHGAGARATRPLWRPHPGTAGLTSAPHASKFSRDGGKSAQTQKCTNTRRRCGWLHVVCGLLVAFIPAKTYFITISRDSDSVSE